MIRTWPFVITCVLEPAAALELGYHRRTSYGRLAFLSLQQTAAHIELAVPPPQPCRHVRICTKVYGTGGRLTHPGYLDSWLDSQQMNGVSEAVLYQYKHRPVASIVATGTAVPASRPVERIQ